MEAISKVCNKCKQERTDFYKNGKICIRCQTYKSSYKKEAVESSVVRTCLKCDKKFRSYGNRKCESCNSLYHDSINSSISSFVSIGY